MSIDANAPRMEVWSIIWVYLAASFLIFCLCGFSVRFDPDGINRILSAGVGAACCAALVKFNLFPRLTAGLSGINQYALVCLGSVMLIYAAAVTQQPLYDKAMLTFDEGLGYRWKIYAEVVAKNPLPFIILSLCYGSIAWQPVAISMSASLTRQHRRLDIYILATMLSLLVTAAIFAFFPVTTAWAYLHIQPEYLRDTLPMSQSGWIKHLLDLRAGQNFAVSLREDASLVGFPSFHMEAAVLGSWFFWRNRFMRWPAIALNAAMAAAAPLFGGHYIADLIAGTMVALGCIWLSHSVLLHIATRQEPRRSRPDPVFNKHGGAQPTLAGRSM